jgi:hypothetical protein
MSEEAEAMYGPVRQSDDRGRFYFWTDPATGVEHRFWSVTTALSAKSKDGLKWWAAQLAARRAMDNLPKLIMSQRREPCGRTYARSEPTRCDECPECLQRWVELYHIGESTRRKHEGSALHDALEAFIKGGLEAIPSPAELGQKYLQEHPGVVEALPPYLATLRKWIEEFAVRPEDFEASEMTIFNAEHQFGGTLDALWRIVARNQRSAKLLARVTGRADHAPALTVVDCKSREGEGKTFYDEHPLQLAAYRNAQYCMPSKVDRLLHPMPKTKGGIILQIRPDGYACEPIATGPNEFAAFLAALKLFQWTAEHGPASIAVKTFPVPDGFVWPPAGPDTEPAKAAPRKRTAARKTTAKAAPAAGTVHIEQPVTTTPPKGSARMAGATLDAIIGTGYGRPGATLTDDDIPF